MNPDRFDHWPRHRFIVIPTIGTLDADGLEWVNERAGIREHCGNLPRHLAEQEALIDFAYFRAGKERKGA
jgi:hypothetical protein